MGAFLIHRDLQASGRACYTTCGRYNSYKSQAIYIVTQKAKKKDMSEYMKSLGRKGGLKTAQKGKDYMSTLGKKGYAALTKKQAKKS